MALIRSARRGDLAATHRVRELWLLADTLDLDGRPAVRRWLKEGRAARAGAAAGTSATERATAGAVERTSE